MLVRWRAVCALPVAGSDGTAGAAEGGWSQRPPPSPPSPPPSPPPLQLPAASIDSHRFLSIEAR